MNRLKLLGLPLSAILLLAALSPSGAQAWGFNWGASERVQGSGVVVHQSRELAAFSRIRVDGSVQVSARQAKQASATVHADDNLQALLQTTVEGDTLVIKTKEGYALQSKEPLRVDVVFSQLSAAELRGSSDLTIDGIQGESLKLSLAGSGDVNLKAAVLQQLSASLAGSGRVTLQGEAQSFKGSIAGSGDIHAEALKAKDVSINVAGSGDARVFASEALSVSIAGSGDVRYAGSPTKLSSQIAGSGRVSTLR